MGLSDKATVTAQYRDSAHLSSRIALHEQFSTNPVGLPRWLFTQMDAPPHARILELGCGVGTLWLKNLDRVPPGWQALLTDASLGMVQQAARALASRKHPFSFAVADAQVLPFPDGCFDAVLANFMLYHVPDRDRALAEVSRVLRTDGVLYAATNGQRHVQEAREIAVRADLLAPGALIAGDAAAFGLQNGVSQLARWFAEIEPRRYVDALVVTEAGPLVAYLLSGWDVQETLARLPHDEAVRRVKELKALIEEELASRGAIHITKDSGLFTAHRPRCFP
jgi:ubiquinone/menaquinone biosynthesis C-methylase UbiE